MSMLEELWNGNVAFGNRPVRSGSRLEDRLALYARNDKILKERLSDSQREQYEKTKDSFNEAVALTEQEAFEIGFTVATQLMMDVMQLTAMDLCAEEIALYAYLMYCENRQTYQCWPSYRTIGSALRMSKNTVRKYVHSLEEKGFLWTEPTKIRKQNGMVQNGNLLYTLRPMQEPINSFHNRSWQEVQRELNRAKLDRLQTARKTWISEHFSTSR